MKTNSPHELTLQELVDLVNAGHRLEEADSVIERHGISRHNLDHHIRCGHVRTYKALGRLLVGAEEWEEFISKRKKPGRPRKSA